MKRIKKPNPSPDLQYFIKTEKEKGCEPVYEGGLDYKKEYTSHFFNVRQQLVKEQGFICCYCQQRIDLIKDETPKMRLEHFKPKNLYDGKKLDDEGNVYQNLTLEYTNLLAACLGRHSGETFCDQRKLGKELLGIPNPADSEFDSFKLRYVAYEAANAKQIRKESDRYVKVIPLWNDKIKKAESEGANQQALDSLKKNDPLTGTAEGCLNLNHQTLMSRRYGSWQSILNVLEKKIPGNWDTDKGRELANQIIKTYQTPDTDGKLKEFCQVMIDLLSRKFKMN